MNTKTARFRVLIFRLSILLVFVVLSWRLWRLQVVEGDEYRLRADDNRFRSSSIEAPRGVVYDRKGTILVRNRPTFTVRLIPANAPAEELEREKMFAVLASLLDMPVTMEPPAEGPQPAALPLVFPPPPRRSQQGIRQLYEKNVIVPYSPITLKTDVDTETASLLSELLVRLPGVELSLEATRDYLTGPLMAHVLGYTGHIPEEQLDSYERDGYHQNDRVGLTGVELSYEEELRGRKGSRTVEVDVAGREIRTVGQVVEPQSGHSLVLTLDAELQRVMETALRKGMEAAKSSSAVAIAMNPKSGEILGLVSLPSFDDNLFSTGISAEDYLRLSVDKSRPLVNHAVGGQYPPGSIFKLVPGAAGLEEGVVDTRDRFLCTGTMWVPNRYFPDDPEMAQPFYCWNRDGHGWVDINSALAQSCDIFFYNLGGGYGDREGIGLDLLAAYMTEFGLGDYTRVDLPGESRGLVPSAKWKRLTYAESWVTGDTYNMTIGQGFVLATPLQMLNVTAAVANGGTLYRPQVVREIIDANRNVVRAFEPEVIRRVPLSEETLDIVRSGMRSAVTWGTATGIDLPQVQVAGKTGTAEFPGPRDYKGRLPTHAWFVAFAPYEDPEIALIVFVYGGGEGSLVSVPVAAEILNYYFAAPPPDEGQWAPAPVVTTTITGTVPLPQPTPNAPAFRGYWR